MVEVEPAVVISKPQFENRKVAKFQVQEFAKSCWTQVGSHSEAELVVCIEEEERAKTSTEMSHQLPEGNAAVGGAWLFPHRTHQNHTHRQTLRRLSAASWENPQLDRTPSWQ